MLMEIVVEIDLNMASLIQDLSLLHRDKKIFFEKVYTISI